MSAGETQNKIINSYVKRILSLLIIFSALASNAQTDEDKVLTTSKEFHQALVQQNKVSINQQTDKACSYGHSNGWIQNKADLIKDFETGRISYQSFKEDSISVVLNSNLATVRFVADIVATNNGVKSNNHLKVVEVWVKKGKRWILFARQGFR
jgi:hypothetical protein